MIRAVEEAGLESLRCFCNSCGGPFACRIQSLADAYGTGLPFARFWLQEIDGYPVAAVSALDHSFCLCTAPHCGWEELSDFLRAVDAVEILCDPVSLKKLSFLPSGRGEILLREPPLSQTLPDGYSLEKNPSPRKIHVLLELCREPGFAPPEFEPFYLDLSHRMRHGAARAVGISDVSGQLAACAVASSETERSAVISAVACRPDARNRGLGSAAVQILSGWLARPVYVFCTFERSIFYQKMGFSSWGEWRESILEESLPTKI